MANVPMLRQTAIFVWRTICLAALLLIFLVGMELIRSLFLIYRIQHIAGIAYGLVLILSASLLMLRALVFMTDRKTLCQRHLFSANNATHKDLKRHCAFLIRYLKRLGKNENLDETLRQKNRQCAYDMEDLFASHPLNEDLQRAIVQAHDEALNPSFEALRKKARELMQTAMTVVGRDLLAPSFATHKLFNQLILAARIVDVYVAHPALYEYFIVLRDAGHVVTEGQLLKPGQNLVQNMYSITPPMGSAIDDLGQLLTSLWFTETVAAATILRCESLEGWRTEKAIAQLKNNTVEALRVTRDALTNNVIPNLKLRIKHLAPPGEVDFVEGINNAFDATIKKLQNSPPQPGDVISTFTTVSTTDTPPPSNPVRRKSLRRSKGVRRVLSTFAERVKYTLRGHKI